MVHSRDFMQGNGLFTRECVYIHHGMDLLLVQNRLPVAKLETLLYRLIQDFCHLRIISEVIQSPV